MHRQHTDETMHEEHAPPNRLGCWLTALTTLATVAVLVGVALFLPPFNLRERLSALNYAPLSQAGDSLTSLDGALRVTLLQASTDEFGLRLTANPANALSPQDPAALALQQLLNRGGMALVSAIYALDPLGDAPELALTLNIPATSRADLLDVYGYHAASQTWRFLPVTIENGRMVLTLERGQMPEQVALFQSAPQAPLVVASVDLRQLLTPEVAQQADIVAPAGLQPTLTGALIGSLAPGFDLNSAYRVMPMIRNYDDPRALDTETISALLANSALRSDHVRQLASLAGGNYAGVWLDYRGLDASQRANFSALLAELSTSLRQVGMNLGVVIPPAENIGGVWETGAYDWQAIGRYADYVKLLTPLNPRSFAPEDNAQVSAMLRYAVSQISRHKLLLGLSAQSIREQNGIFSRVGYNEALTPLGSLEVTSGKVAADGSVEPGTEIRATLNGLDAIAGVDLQLQTPFLDYLDRNGNRSARLWLTTDDALRYRMELSIPYALRGVGFDDLLSDDLAEGVLNAIVDYRTQLPIAPAPTDLALRWTISGSDGSQENLTTNINDDLVVTLSAPDVRYTFNVALVGVGEQAPNVVQGVAVAVALPTATPTPLPTATPTPTPTLTPTPAPIIPTQAPSASSGGGAIANPSGGGWSASAPVAGSIQVGNFEYGGHVESATSGRAIAAMRQAGMTWMKVQIRYNPGMDISAAAGAIGAAKSNGFKILIGTSGNPQNILEGGEAYFQSFAQWLGNVASLGPDAIEVWNEPNLDREWPTGKLSPSDYTLMLRYAYQAIKQANSSVAVISAALAPTGAEGAYPGRVINDDRFLREMVGAGALNYADCVGVHYNEGIIPPSATSGDPRDGYYTRYFLGIMNTYWNITGGQKPLCFTELGYVTPEGLPPLPDYFAWGSNVTVAQQAAWLAEAAALSSQSGKVRLMIVWNVDFSYYGTDPMAGFAIIRPDGSCPACVALASAR